MKFSLNKLIIFFLLAVIGSHCTNAKKELALKAFYYPYEDLKNGLIYEYIPLNDPSFSHVYWYLQSEQVAGKWYINEVYFEDNFIPLQYIKEKIVSNGVLTKKVNLFLQDTSGVSVEVDGDLHAGNVFSFTGKKYGNILLSNFTFKIPDGSNNTTTIIKNRQFEGYTTINIAGHEYQTARFGVKELVSMGNEKDGYTEPEFIGIEQYAKGIGLAYYKKEAEGKTIIEYGLNKRYHLNVAAPQLRAAIESFLNKK